MKVLENGDYQLEDGRVLPADQVGKQFKAAPKSATLVPVKNEPKPLEEGASSGVIMLED